MLIWNFVSSYFLLALCITPRSRETINHVSYYVSGISCKAEKLYECLNNELEEDNRKS